MIDVVERTAAAVFIPLTVGGGVRSVEDMHTLLTAGADKVSLNTAAVQDPDLISRGAAAFGRQCIVVAIDARRDPARPSGWGVTTHGGRTLVEGLDVLAWAAEVERRGAGEILLTSMDRDGTKDGFDLPLIQAVAATVNIPVIASGGAGTLDHFAAVLAPGGAEAALAASIFHFGEYTVEGVKAYLASQGVAVRLGTQS
jgi:cyclase